MLGQDLSSIQAQQLATLLSELGRWGKRINLTAILDPDEMISLSSDIVAMSALRAEVCRIPRKPNGMGLIQIMSKEEMARQKPPLPSPNMADSLMMSLANPPPRQADAPLNFRSVYGK